MAGIPRTRLTPHYEISRVIKGGWQLAGDHGPVNPDTVDRDMAAFVEAGITTFDCAGIYTGVEAMIGEFRGRHPTLAERTPVHRPARSRAIPLVGLRGATLCRGSDGPGSPADQGQDRAYRRNQHRRSTPDGAARCGSARRRAPIAVFAPGCASAERHGPGLSGPGYRTAVLWHRRRRVSV